MSHQTLADSPTAWFAVLERAIRAGNRELEEHARSQLARLGVDVEFRLPLLTIRRQQGGAN